MAIEMKGRKRYIGEYAGTPVNSMWATSAELALEELWKCLRRHRLDADRAKFTVKEAKRRSA